MPDNVELYVSENYLEEKGLNGSRRAKILAHFGFSTKVKDEEIDVSKDERYEEPVLEVQNGSVEINHEGRSDIKTASNHLDLEKEGSSTSAKY